MAARQALEVHHGFDRRIEVAVVGHGQIPQVHGFLLQPQRLLLVAFEAGVEEFDRFGAPAIGGAGHRAAHAVLDGGQAIEAELTGEVMDAVADKVIAPEEFFPISGALLYGDHRVDIGQARDDLGRHLVHVIAGNVVEHDRQVDGVGDHLVMGDKVVRRMQFGEKRG